MRTAKKRSKTARRERGDRIDPLAHIPDELIVQSYNIRFAARGGKARWRGVSVEERRAHAKKAAAARWGKRKTRER